jgi:hypothetical protein
MSGLLCLLQYFQARRTPPLGIKSDHSAPQQMSADLRTILSFG